MAKKKPYAPPKLSRYESQPETPIVSRSADAGELLSKTEGRFGLQVAPDYTTVVDTNRRYIEVSDSFCQLVGYGRQDLIGKTYDELSAPRTNDIPTVFRLFVKNGYMHGLWMLVHRSGTRILVRYEAWVRPDCQIQSNMELVGSGYGEANRI